MNPRAPALVLCSKADLLSEIDLAGHIRTLAGATDTPVIATSALTGRGLAQVERTLADMLHLHASRSGQAVGLHHWQRRCVSAAGDACRRTAMLLQDSKRVADQAELLAVELRTAIAELGQISGQVTNEEVLGRIFARFCVGK